MIRLYLPNNFENIVQIDQIYNRLAQNIYDEQGANQITYEYQGGQGRFDSPASIKQFLLAKDFYDYHIEQSFGFMRSLVNLNGNVKISSILNATSKSKNVRDFLQRYEKSRYKKYYDSLKKHQMLTISGFKKCKSHHYLLNYQRVCHVFDYEKLTFQDRHQILNAMNIPVCPYCNMNYTISFRRNTTVRNTADIDHFFLKREYPEYSLCLYNFVPACPVCNQKIKGTKSMTHKTHVYPHQEGFKDKSHFRVTNLLELLLQPHTHAKIELVSQKSDYKVDNSIKDFMLNERYEGFSYVGEELIEKAQIYNDTYTNILCQTIDGLIDVVNVKYAIFGSKLSESQYGRLSLGKLRQDILDQLKVFDT